MARPIEFDRDQSIKSAAQLFWKQGYLATSLAQILSEMNIGKSSFYAAFGDKRSLFLEVLCWYNQSYQDLLDKIRKSNSPEDAIAWYIDYSLYSIDPAAVSNGCLIVNTLLELTGIDDELSELATEQLLRVEEAFIECFSNAESAGKLVLAQKPRQLAKLFMTFNQGLRVSARKGTTTKQLKSQSQLFTSLLFKNEATKTAH